MKTFIVTLLISLCMIQGFANNDVEEENKITSKQKTPPPYHKRGQPKYFYSSSVFALNVSSDLERIFRQISKSTCLNFKKQSTLIQNTIGINFELSTTNNTVELSYNSDHPTNVSLTENVYKNKTHLLFFIGIALDIIPEIRRPDSYKDVSVNKSNINTTFYEKYFENITDLTSISYIVGTDFDFKSPMFVDPYFLSNNSEPTYTIKGKLYKDYQYFYGGLRSFRFNDYKHIYSYYCKAKQSDVCMYGGYKLNKGIYKDKCKCPEYLNGTKCEKFFPNDNNCTILTQNITATKEKKYFNLTITKGNCYFNITSQNGKNVSVTIESLAFDKTDCSTGRSFLEVLVRNDKGAAGINFCKNTINKTLPALSNQVFLVFSNGDQNLTFNASYVEKSENNLNRNNRQNAVAQQKHQCLITVKPKCKCKNGQGEDISVKLLEKCDKIYDFPIVSNSNTNQVSCNRNSTLKPRKNIDNPEDYCVKIEHYCNINGHSTSLIKLKECNQSKESNNYIKYICREE